ncbi:MAG: phage portal protein [Spirochaetales bacterium]|nr:phage portal protein [Spirochaetales bacterium]
MIPIYQLPEAYRLTEKQILSAISWKTGINSDISKADSYYRGRNTAILSSDSTHKIPVPYGRKLIKSVLGFMFKEGLITYSWPDDWDSFQTVMEKVMNSNHEPTENRRLAKDQAMYGSAYEAVFVDNDEARVQFYRIPAYQVIPVYSYGIKPEMWAAINFYRVKKECFIEVYYRDRIEHFFKGQNGLTMTRIVPHQFGEVPIIEYRNNEEGMGDIESITSLIDAHDEIIANGLDEDGKFADAILKLKNMELDDETVDKLIRLRVLTMDDDGEADYLVKPDRYEGREILRKVIEGLIFSMSGIPNLDDRDAMAQQSGEALKYLYATFEIMVAGDKQSGFNDGLVRRLQLINNFLTWLGSSHVEMDGVSIKWQRNLPSEGTVIVDNVVKVTNIVSRKTQLEQLQKAGIVDSVPEELARLEEERSEIESDLTDSEGIDAAYGQQTV